MLAGLPSRVHVDTGPLVAAATMLGSVTMHAWFRMVSLVGCSVAVPAIAACKDDPSGHHDDGSTGGSSLGDSTAPGDSSGMTGPAPDLGGVETTANSMGGSSESGTTTGPDVHCGDGTSDPGGICFGPSVTVFDAAPAAAVVALDLDADGLADLAIGHRDGLTILFGNGSGGFTPGQELAVPGVLGLARGDLGGDAMPDLVMSHGDDDSITIAINDGSGTVVVDAQLPIVGAPVPAGPDAIAVADFDDDGDDDVAVLGALDASAHLFAQNAGGFDEVWTGPIGGSPGGLAAGRIGADAPGLAIANLAGTSVAVLTYTGGGFDTSDSVVVGAGPRGVALANLFGGGQAELVAASSDDGTVAIATGIDGGFAGVQVLAAGPQPRALAIDDVDNDGRDDVVVSLAGANAVAVLLQIDDGVFAAAQAVATITAPGAIASADFNGDGLVDLAVASAADAGGVAIALSDP